MTSMAANVSPLESYQASCKSLRVHCNSSFEVFLAKQTPGAPLSQVKHLDLSKNFFGRRGMLSVLRSVLSLCTSLESLNLSHNNLSNETVEDLYSILAGTSVCPNLQRLDVSHNPISSPSGKLLSRLVEQRSSLRWVVVDGTLMNVGLVALIHNKCAKKSPRYSGLHALSLVAEEQRLFKVGSSGRPSPQPEAPEQQAAADLPAAAEEASSSPQHQPANVMTAKRLVSANGGVARPAAGGGVESEAEWSAMETIWTLAAVAAPPDDGWTGLAAVMALVRQDVTIASMY